jgi:hypothetical protein
MSVMVQSSGNFQKLVGLYENPLLEYWQDKYAAATRDSIIPLLFDTIQTDNASEAIGEMVGAIDFTQWNGEFTYSSVKEGGTKVFTPIVFQAGMKYDRFLLSNAKLVNLKTEHGMFALGAARTRSECAGGIFTYADQAGGYSVNGVPLLWNIVANGLPLASNSHTSANFGSTQDNLEALELNEENLETLCQKLFDVKDESGKRCGMNPDMLVVPTALRKRALEIVGSTGKSDTGDNNPNVYDGNIKVCVWSDFRRQPGKTGQPWAVIDSQAARESLKILNRLESGDEYEIISWKDEATQTWTLGSIMWFTMGSFSWHWGQFSIPA